MTECVGTVKECSCHVFDTELPVSVLLASNDCLWVGVCITDLLCNLIYDVRY